jgi:Fe-S oxidoreductase
MMAMQNVQVLNGYGIKKIVTGCPHCFNTIKNEYPQLGGNFDVIHHTQLINQLMKEGKISIKGGGAYHGKKITFHDPCYLGRGNDVYEAPREVLSKLDAELSEMKRSRQHGLCCGAGGAQMFKEAEPGNKEVNVERTEDAIETTATVIATGCPFCNTMMTDGVKHFEKENTIVVKDVAELVAEAADL